jgi:nicotinamidase-related amidase
MTRDRIDPDLIDLVPPLKTLVPPALVIDKQHYSPFAEPDLHAFLVQQSVDTLVMTGAETDVCVLASVLDAVDLGYRVVLVRDGLCSVSDKTHDALLTLYEERFGQQIEAASAGAILAQWP